MEEEVPGLIEKGLIANDQVVTVLENGKVIIQASDEAELRLSARAAYDLLLLLYDHRELLSGASTGPR
jgi:hypothetical protein